MTRGAWVERAAVAAPATVALEAPEGTLTYAELLVRARERRPLEATAPLDAEPTLAFAAALHGAWLAGAAALPLDPRLPEAERDARRRAARAGPGAALLLFTSGTTAAPEPVALTYENLLWSALGSAVALGLDSEERWLCVLPLAHVGGLSILTRSAIYGTTVVLHERFDAEEATRAVMEEGITLVSLVPTMLARMLDAGLRGPSRLRHALVGGAPLAPALRARAEAAGVPVAETYGMTEAASQAVTEGVPLPGVAVELAEDGEIVLSGPSIAGGGPLRTGDLGRWDAGGRLRVRGRKGDTIITGGENVAPQEVEEALLAHPGVEDAAVVGRPDPEWGEAVVALVVGGASGEELRAWARGRLAPFQVPKRVERVDTLPRNAAGKLDRRRLRP